MIIEKGLSKSIQNLQQHCRNLDGFVKIEICIDGKYVDVLNANVGTTTKRVYMVESCDRSKRMEVSSDLYNSLLATQKYCSEHTKSVKVEFSDDDSEINDDILKLVISSRLIRVCEVTEVTK